MPEIDYSDSAISGVGRPTIEHGDKPGEVFVPKNSIPNANSAQVVYDRMRNSHTKRALTFARIQGMLDGNPPFNKSQLQRGGFQTRSNVNWRDGESIVESIVLVYWSLFNDVQYMTQFTTDIGDPNQNPETGEIASREFDKAIREWDKLMPLMTQHQLDLISFGYSFLFWPDERNWQFDVADVWRTLFPERTRNHIDHINIIAFEHTYSAHELYQLIQNPNTSEKWNKEELASLLAQIIFDQDKGKHTKQEYAELQTSIRNGDLSYDEIDSDDILLISMFVKEYDGEVSRGIFHPDLIGNESGEYLFFSDRQYDSMSEVVHLFTFTPGEKFVHGNKGMGHKIFNTVEGMTHVDNSVMDSVRRSSTVLVRTRSTRGRDPKQIQFDYGGITDIGEADFLQNLMGANLAPSVEVARYFRAKLNENNSISGSMMSTPDGKPPTLGQAQLQVTREARVQKNRIAHYYEQLDFLFRKIVQKMLRAKEGDPGYEIVALWKKRSIEKGVPEEFFALTKENEGQNGLPEHMEVRATRAAGSGSQVADQIETQQMMELLPVVGERGRETILKDRIAAVRGFRYLDRYYPPEDRTKQPTGDDTLASVENNQLEKGEMVVVSPDNNHAIHAERHIQRLQQIAKAYNDAESQARLSGSRTPSVDAGEFGQYSLEETDVAFQTIGPHFVRHLLYLQQDPTRASLAQSLAARWAILANFGDKIANNAQEHRSKQLREAQDQQEQMDEMDMEERVKMREVELNAQIKMRKLLADIQRSATRDSLQNLLDRQRTSLENEIKRSKAATDIAIQVQKANKSDEEQVRGKTPNEVV